MQAKETTSWTQPGMEGNLLEALLFTYSALRGAVAPLASALRVSSARLYPHMQANETTSLTQQGMEGNLPEALLFTYMHGGYPQRGSTPHTQGLYSRPADCPLGCAHARRHLTTGQWTAQSGALTLGGATAGTQQNVVPTRPQTALSGVFTLGGHYCASGRPSRVCSH